MKAMIFAAGLGTRLRPITDSMPKALVRVGGVPMLERVILSLKASGIDSFVVNVHHYADMIVSFLEENNNFGVQIDISREEEQALETGGGIRHAAPFLRGSGRFLVYNVDILSDLNLKQLQECDRPESLATLVLAPARDPRRLLFDSSMRLKGWTDLRSGLVRGVPEEIEFSALLQYSFTGIHILSEKALDMMDSYPKAFSIRDFYLDVAKDHLIRGVLMDNLHYIDIGSIEALERANAALSCPRGVEAL